MATGFLYDKRYLDHHPGPGHPERPERLIAAMSYLQAQPWFAALKRYAPREIERDWIETTHSSSYIDRARRGIEEDGVPFLDTPDVGVSADSFDVAVLAAGGCWSSRIV